jgi:DNA-binding GntR family transcriptional regulator
MEWNEAAADPIDLDASRDGTLAGQAYARLRRDIVAGVRAPGERLRIERLRGLYGLGPTPLREALQRLCADGWVVAEGHRGFTVAPLSAELFDDLNTARIAVEQQALRLAIARGDADWEAALVGAAYRLARADERLRAGSEGGLDAWERANRAFHAALVAACGSVWLLRVRDLLQSQCERYRRVSIRRTREGRDLHAEHQALASAALARDADRACGLLAAHFGRTADLLRGELASSDRRPQPARSSR